MAISYLSNINLNNNELKSFIVDNLAAAPTVNVADQGNLIYNTALGALQYKEELKQLVMDKVHQS